MTSQDHYRTFASTAPDLPLFLQPWYLDAVCEEGRWDAALAYKGEQLVAVLPYYLKRKFHWKYVAMPRLCKFMGPYILPKFRHLNEETHLFESLIGQLPKQLSAFEQDVNYAVVNWLPFYWAGFRQSTRYSYVLDLNLSESELYEQISKNYRQKIKAAKEKLMVSTGHSLLELQRLVALSFARQGLAAPFTPKFLEGLYDALNSHHSCQLFFAVDPDNQAVHSAALLAWDKQSAYYLLSGDDPSLRASGSAILLKWEAILFAKNTLHLPVFDFEGSMIRSIEIGRRDFGAQQRQYFRLQKEWSKWWALGKWLWR
jgi:hypothetical protein